MDPAVDNVFINVSPGESWTYTYKIPTDHAPGFHWYHSHKHGSSAMQVMGGLIGAIYVNPTTEAITASSALTSLGSLRRVALVAQHFSIASINTNHDPFTVRTYTDLSSATGSTLPINATFANSLYKDVYFINGQFQPQVIRYVIRVVTCLLILIRKYAI